LTCSGNIEADEDDFQRYRYLIPVLDMRGQVALPPLPETVRNAPQSQATT
jgi:hypothetical protein